LGSILHIQGHRDERDEQGYNLLCKIEPTKKFLYVRPLEQILVYSVMDFFATSPQIHLESV